MSCAEERTDESFIRAREFERLRNQKIDYLCEDTEYSKTSYFTIHSSWDDFFANNNGIFSFDKQKKILQNSNTAVIKLDTNTNYTSLIDESLKNPLNNPFDQVKEYERLRNEKIDILQSSEYYKTDYFTNFNSWNELFLNGTMDSYLIEKNYKYIITTDYLNLRISPDIDSDKIGGFRKNTSVTYLGTVIDNEGNDWYKVTKDGQTGYIFSDYAKYYDNTPPTTKYNYTDEDVYWLAVAITMEAGCSWYPEYVRNYVGCVVLNRVESERFYADTIYDVLHSPGQYSWANKYHKEPFDWCIETAKDLLNGNRMLPSNVVYQANFKQGTFTYHKFYDEVLGSTSYFCGI